MRQEYVKVCCSVMKKKEGQEQVRPSLRREKKKKEEEGGRVREVFVGSDFGAFPDWERRASRRHSLSSSIPHLLLGSMVFSPTSLA